MRITNITLKSTAIVLGRQGENEAALIRFDLSPWIEMFDTVGTFSIWHQRFGDEEKYPVSITQEEGIVDWVVTSDDTAKCGVGKCEIVYTIGESIMKSKTLDAIVEQSLTGEEIETPAPYESWVNDVLVAAGSIETSANEAKEAAAIAQENAASITEAAEQISNNIQTAIDSAQSANESALAAQTSELNARAYSDSASQHATNAALSERNALEASESAESYANAVQDSNETATELLNNTRSMSEGVKQFLEGDMKEYFDETLQSTKAYTDQVFDAMVEALASIGEVIEDNRKTDIKINDVNFFDYDGTLVDSYTFEEAKLLTTLPTPPEHQGLTFAGWNHSLEEVTTATNKYNIGATYNTDDGCTHLKILIRGESRSTLPLCFYQSMERGVSIDWGDGSVVDTIDSVGNVDITHKYDQTGSYVIKMKPANGCVFTLGHDTEADCVFGPAASNVAGGRAYLDCLTEVNIGEGVTSITKYTFQNCPSLKYITIPTGLSYIGENAFEYCYNLRSVVLPSGNISIDRYSFQYCNNLESIIGGDGETSVLDYAFLNCRSLTTVSFSNKIILGGSAFMSCESLQEFAIPEGTTVVPEYAFGNCYSLNDVGIPSSIETISSRAFNGCVSLAEVILLDVKQIGSYAFNGCYGIGAVHIKSTTPPTLSNTNAFANTASDKIFYVPASAVEQYKNYAGWNVYSSYIQAEE